jgi:hypothetical protein
MLVAATAVGGLALSGLMTAGAASATTIGAGTHGPSSGYFAPDTGSRAIGRIAAKAISNRVFAGYQTAVRAGSATVSAASFTVPTLTCTTTDRGITNSAGVEENNYKTASVSVVFSGCVNGQAVYFPILVDNGREKDYTSTPLAAGDVIDVTTKVSTNRTRVQVTDVTTNVTEKKIGPGASASAAYMGDTGAASSTGSLQHVPDFGKLTFKNCLVDGKALASWHPQAYQRVNSIGRVQITTGGFWPGGTAFTTHFQHS